MIRFLMFAILLALIITIVFKFIYNWFKPVKEAGERVELNKRKKWYKFWKKIK